MSQPLEEIKDAFLNLKKELGEVTYQLINLYDRWVVEHQYVARREAEMMRSIELFTKKTEELSEIKQRIQEDIKSTSKEMAKQVGQWVAAETEKAFQGAIQRLVIRFEDAVTKVEQVVPQYERLKEGSVLKGATIAVLISLILGFLAGAYFFR